MILAYSTDRDIAIRHARGYAKSQRRTMAFGYDLEKQCWIVWDYLRSAKGDFDGHTIRYVLIHGEVCKLA